MIEKVPIIHTIAALDSMRKRGITLVNAIQELVDNSWDWMGNSRLMNDARIRIHAELNSDDSLTVSVLDSGEGITQYVREDEQDGIGIPVSSSEEANRDGLQMALRIGGRITKSRSNAIGRFGFGLPQSAIALCYDTQTNVFTKTRAGPWRNLALNIARIKESRDSENRPLLGKPVLLENGPPAELVPEGWKWTQSGTMIIFENIEEKFHRIKVMDTFLAELKLRLARVYRYAIESGLEIVVTSPDNLDLTPIKPWDPLCQMRGSETARFGPVDDTALQTLVFDGAGSKPLIVDPTTGLPAIIEIRFARIDRQIVIKQLGDEKSGTYRKFNKRYGFNLAGQGFSLVRGDREIGHAENLGLYTPHPVLNYFRGEIRFPPIVELDRMFGVEPDKAKFRITGRMQQWMQNARRTINEMTSRAKKDIRFANLNKRKSRTSTTKGRKIPRRKLEQKSSLLKQAAPPIQSTKSDEELKSARLRLEEGDRDALKLEYADMIMAAEDSKKRAEEVEDYIAIQEAEERIAALRAEFDWSLKNLNERFGEEAYFRTHHKDELSNTLYWAQWTDQGPRIALNKTTSFYNDAYGRTEEDSKQRAIFDLMLWAIAYADGNPNNSQEKKDFWNRIRPLIARTIERMLSSKDTVEEVRQPTRRKYEVMLDICDILGLQPPAQNKGSTIPSSFYLDVVEALTGERKSGIGKHQSYTMAITAAGSQIKHELHLSTGGTVTLQGLIDLETAVKQNQQN